MNWNHNTFPKEKYLKVDISKKLNNMIYVNSIGYNAEKDVDIDCCWSGWLPTSSIKLIKEL